MQSPYLFLPAFFKKNLTTGPFPSQIYIGPSRRTVVQNRDVTKELQVGMLVAVQEAAFVQIGTVQAIPPDPHNDTLVTVHWMEQERAPHKPKWLRYFKPAPITKKNAVGTVTFADIMLYDFQLTKSGALKKKSREYICKNT